ncbi:MAG: glycosyltransferase family 4 protein [Elainella sp. C42_A2020_010]|nr:glycosyltransferase family 4 protein [Elainella sp. C42_A2020_010]
MLPSHKILTAERQTACRSTIALLHCYDLIEDFLQTLNLSFQEFCDQFMGSWMFGYIIALQKANVRVVLFCISAQVQTPTRFLHRPTGATICVLPPTKLYRFYRKLRRHSLSLYGAEAGQSFKDVQSASSGLRAGLTPIKDFLKSLGTYCCMPLNLLADELRRENCQVILCQEYEYARFDVCVLLGKWLRLPVFATFQGGDRTQSGLEVPLRWLTLQQCTGLIIPSQREIERVRQRYPIANRPIAKIFNPFDPSVWSTQLANNRQELRQQARQQLGIPASAQVVIWHGRVEIERKGLDILLAVWQQIQQRRQGRDLRLLLVGTGSDAQQLQQRLAANPLPGLEWHKEFIRDQPRLGQYLHAADIYVFPSRLEGFPLAPLEAMACGLPIVAADAPGIPDILPDGEANGGLVVSRGDVGALADALGKLLDDSGWAETLGQRAYQHVQSFSMEVIGQQLREFLLSSSDQTDLLTTQKIESTV